MVGWSVAQSEMYIASASNNRLSTAAFTLIELLVVIAIIAILAAILLLPPPTTTAAVRFLLPMDTPNCIAGREAKPSVTTILSG